MPKRSGRPSRALTPCGVARRRWRQWRAHSMLRARQPWLSRLRSWAARALPTAVQTRSPLCLCTQRIRQRPLLVLRTHSGGSSSTRTTSNNSTQSLMWDPLQCQNVREGSVGDLLPRQTHARDTFPRRLSPHPLRDSSSSHTQRSHRWGLRCGQMEWRRNHKPPAPTTTPTRGAVQ